MLDVKIAEVGMYSDAYGAAKFDQKALMLKRDISQ
jgi:hypothetical protein